MSHLWGGGHIANVLTEHGYVVDARDIVYRGYKNTKIEDFLKRNSPIETDVIQNPPYKYAKEFYEHTAELLEEGRKSAFFFKLTFLEGQARRIVFDRYPFKKLYVFSRRVPCAKNGDFNMDNGSAVAYGWYIFEKGYKGKPTIELGVNIAYNVSRIDVARLK